jgi:hypothetical protein
LAGKNPGHQLLGDLVSTVSRGDACLPLDTADNVRAFAAAHPVNYPLLIGGAAGVDLARQFGNAGLALPYTLLIAPDGDLRLVRLGPISESELDLAVHQSLAR